DRSDRGRALHLVELRVSESLAVARGRGRREARRRGLSQRDAPPRRPRPCLRLDGQHRRSPKGPPRGAPPAQRPVNLGIRLRRPLLRRGPRELPRLARKRVRRPRRPARLLEFGFHLRRPPLQSPLPDPRPSPQYPFVKTRLGCPVPKSPILIE